MKILYRGIFVENFLSPKMGQKLTVFVGLDREKCECQGNQTTPKHVIQCKKYSDTPKNVFSGAWQEKL